MLLISTSLILLLLFNWPMAVSKGMEILLYTSKEVFPTSFLPSDPFQKLLYIYITIRFEGS